MRRFAIMLAAAWFLAMGTGLAEHIHNAQHAAEDARASALFNPADSPGDRQPPIHDDSNCAIHTQLHLPLIASPMIVLLICAGLIVAFVTQLAPTPDCTRLPSRLDCRSPPALR